MSILYAVLENIEWDEKGGKNCAGENRVHALQFLLPLALPVCQPGSCFNSSLRLTAL